MPAYENNVHSIFEKREVPAIIIAQMLLQEFEEDFTDEQRDILSALKKRDLIRLMAAQITEHQMKVGVFNFKLPILYKDKYGNLHKEIILTFTL